MRSIFNGVVQLQVSCGAGFLTFCIFSVLESMRSNCFTRVQLGTKWWLSFPFSEFCCRMLAKFCPRTAWQRRIQQRYVAVHSLYGIRFSLICCQAHLPTCFLNLLPVFLPCWTYQEHQHPHVYCELRIWFLAGEVITILLITSSTGQFGNILPAVTV